MDSSNFELPPPHIDNIYAFESASVTEYIQCTLFWQKNNK